MAVPMKIERTGGMAERLGAMVSGGSHAIGSGFTARHFSEEAFAGAMDPLIMVDHFVMTAPTFEPHLHVGISAVTAMFEDSTGDFLNRDTLGRDVALQPGELYWLAAASGAAHEERPAEGARVHALQIFVNLPARLKTEPARALHVRRDHVPILDGPGHRVRILLGRSGDVVGAEGTPEEMTMLDGFLEQEGDFAHELPEERQAWIYAISGRLIVRCGDEERVLQHGVATTVRAGAPARIALEAAEPSHFVLMAAKPIREAFVRRGPLVTPTVADAKHILASY